MIPVTRQTDGIDPSADTQRELIVFGAPQDVADAYLYEDDGDTSDWQGDGRLELRFQLRRSGKDLVLSVDSIGSYRPAFDTVSVHPVAIEGQIRVETPEGIHQRRARAHRRSKIESVPHRCSNSMKDVIHETSLAMVRAQ